MTPHFIVHRGHALHVDKTIAQIPRAAELVFLGSCRGLTKMQQVMEMAPQAQVFVTRGIGSHSINDPVLHALNGALLSGAVTWESFWRQMELRLGRNALFADYVPPHKNAAAQFLRAYHELSRQ